MPGFLGASIRQSYRYPNNSVEYAGSSLAPVTYVVGNGVEASNNYFSVDIDDNAIHIGFLTNSSFGSLVSFSGPVFADFGASLADIIGVTLTTNMPGLDLGDISWDANSIAVNWAGLQFNTAYTITLGVTLAQALPDHVSFTASGDGSAAHPIDFNSFAGTAHIFDGQRYASLSGNDFVILPDMASVNAHNPWNYNITFNAGASDDVIQGGDGKDLILGASGNDWLYGGAGADRLDGATGNDILSGGRGADRLTSGSGHDIFVLTGSELGSTRAAGQHDVVTDFATGLDKIDLSALYADHAFGGLAKAPLSGTEASAWQVGLYRSDGATWLEGDVTGDGHADFVIQLGSTTKLLASDLITTHDGFAAAAGPTAFEYAAMHSDQLLPHG